MVAGVVLHDLYLATGGGKVKRSEGKWPKSCNVLAREGKSALHPGPGGAWGFGPGLLVQHVYFGECEFDSLTALQAHGEAPYLARFGVFDKVDNLPVFSTVEAALHGGCRSAYPDPPT
jgi:hypothetical protein